MRALKWLAYGALAILVTLVIAGVAVPFVVDPNDYKEEIARRVMDATGFELAVDGDIALRLLPRSELSVAGIRLVRPGDGEGVPILEIAAVEARFRLLPLLSNAFVIESLVLREPTIALERTASGRLRVAGEREGGQPSEADVGPTRPVVRIDRFVIARGTLTYRDVVSQRDERIERIEAVVSVVDTVRGPFAAEGSLQVRGLPVRFALETGRIDRAEPARITARLATETGASEVTVVGTYALAETAANATVSLRSANPGAIVEVLGGASSPLLAQAFAVDAIVDWTDSAFTVSPLTASLGSIVVEGGIEGQLGEPTHINAQLASPALDLDTLLPLLRVELEDEDTGREIEFPTDLEGEVGLVIGAVTYRGGIIRDARLAARLSEATIDIDELAAELPGITAVTVSGRIHKVAAAPAFVGSAAVASDEPHVLLEWLDVVAVKLPDGLLGALAASAAIDIGSAAARLSNLTVAIDESTLRGTISFVEGVRPLLDAELALDAIEIDPYLAMFERAGEEEVIGEPGSPGGALAFDARLNAEIGRIGVGGEEVLGVRMVASLDGDSLTVDDLRITDFAGATAEASGMVGIAGDLPVDANLRLHAGDARRMAGLLGIDTRLATASLEVTLSAVGTAANSRIEGVLSLNQLGLRFAGAATDFGTQFELDFDIAHPDPVGLLRSGGAAAPATGLGAAALAGHFTAGPEAVAIRDLVGEIAGTSVLGEMRAAFKESAQYEIAARMGTVDLDRLLAALSTDEEAAETGRPPDVEAVFVPPADIEAAIAVTFDALVYQGAPIRDAAFEGLLKDGQVNVPRASAVLPGGGRIGIEGTIAGAPGPTFDGTVTLLAEDTPALLSWFALAPPPVLAPWLGALDLKSQVTASAAAVSFRELDLAIGDSRIGGAASLALDQPGALRLDLSVDPAGGGAPGAAPGGRVFVEGNIGAIEAPALDLAWTLSHPDLSHLLLVIAGYEPAGGEDLGEVILSGRLSGSFDGAMAIDDVQGHAGASAFEGRLHVDGRPDRPRFVARLSSPFIDFRPYLPPLRDKEMPLPEEGAESPELAAEKVFSPDPLPLVLLHEVDAQVELRAGVILTRRLALHDVEADAALRDGVLTISPVRAFVGGGTLSAQAELVAAVAGETAEASASLRLEGVASGDVLKDLDVSDTLTGTIDSELDVTASGGSVAALMAGLDGRAKVIIGEGQIDAYYIDLIGGGLGSTAVRLLIPSTGEGDYSVLNCFVADIVATDGVARTNSLVLDTASTTVVGDGDLDLGTEALDISLKLSPKDGVPLVDESLGELKAFRLGGTLARPALGVDAPEAAFAFGKALGGVVLFGPAGIAAALLGGSLGGDNACVAAVEAAERGVKLEQKGVTEKAVEGVKKTVEGIGDTLKDLFTD